MLLAITGGAATAQTVQLNLVMRSKLQHSQRILEAVVTSNWTLLDTESKALAGVTRDPAWSVLQFPEYVRHSTAFVRATDDLIRRHGFGTSRARRWVSSRSRPAASRATATWRDRESSPSAMTPHSVPVAGRSMRGDVSTPAGVNRALRWAALGLGVTAVTYGAVAAAAWCRYGHAAAPRPDETDPALDEFMPDYEVAERHHVRVLAPADATMRAAKAVAWKDRRSSAPSSGRASWRLAPIPGRRLSPPGSSTRCRRSAGACSTRNPDARSSWVR